MEVTGKATDVRVKFIFECADDVGVLSVGVGILLSVDDNQQKEQQ